jgi:type II secretory pathway pseudopilin PulG
MGRASGRDRTPRGASSGTGQEGYTLIVLVIAVAVINVLVAASLPYWSHVIQRDKEEELVSRGLQYAEAIRIFQIKNHRLPVRLDELILSKPRFIRQLWKDPMTDDGKWGLIFQGGDQPVQPQPPGTGTDGRGGSQMNNTGGQKGGSTNPGDTGTADDPNQPPKKGDEVAVGPLLGVYSKSHKESLLVFNGRNRYDEWRFTFDLLQAVRAVPPGGGAAVPGGMPGAAPMPMRWIGRPFPPIVNSGFKPPTGPGDVQVDEHGLPIKPVNPGSKPGVPPSKGPGGRNGRP